jgi:hypothetical protein
VDAEDLNGEVEPVVDWGNRVVYSMGPTLSLGTTMTDPTTAYFPLRSNAAALLAGRQITEVRRRIKRAALLHDEVILEAGTYDLHAGPTGSSAWWRGPDGRERWQTLTLRGKAQEGNFWVGARLSDAPEESPMHPMVHSGATVAWIATLEPLKRELPKAFRWLLYGHGDDHPAVKREATSIFNPDYKDERLTALWPGSFVRKAIIGNFGMDLAMAALAGATVSFDRTHGAVVQARVQRGDAEWVLGDLALRVVLAADPSWEEVDALRRTRGFRDYRAILREVEAAAREQAGGGRIEERVWREYAHRLEAAASKRPSGKAKATVALVSAGAGFGVSMAAGGTPGVGDVVSLAVGAIGERIADHIATPAWLSMHRGVRTLPQPRRRESVA